MEVAGVIYYLDSEGGGGDQDTNPCAESQEMLWDPGICFGWGVV